MLRLAIVLAMLTSAAAAQEAQQRIGAPPEKQNIELVGWSDLQARSAYQPTIHQSNGRWIAALVLTALIPAVTYYPAFALAGNFVKASPYLPQGVTNQIMIRRASGTITPLWRRMYMWPMRSCSQWPPTCPMMAPRTGAT